MRALRSLRSCGKGLRGDEDEAGVLASGCLVLGVEGDEVLDVGSDQSATASGGFREDLLIGEPDQT